MTTTSQPSNKDYKSAALADISYIVNDGDKPTFDGQDIFLKRFLLALQTWLCSLDDNFELLVTTGSILLGKQLIVPSVAEGVAILEGFAPLYDWSAPSPSRHTAAVTGSTDPVVPTTPASTPTEEPSKTLPAHATPSAVHIARKDSELCDQILSCFVLGASRIKLKERAKSSGRELLRLLHNQVVSYMSDAGPQAIETIIRRFFVLGMTELGAMRRGIL